MPLLKRGRCKGSPACAGIDPPDAGAAVFEPWFPRVRGDRPKNDPSVTVGWLVPPRARG